ncbi:MAG: hypothetical protein EXR79_06480 [Myxococcales bacterium]|nr:hypothetical protein [Myxococcales bacterium]
MNLPMNLRKTVVAVIAIAVPAAVGLWLLHGRNAGAAQGVAAPVPAGIAAQAASPPVAATPQAPTSGAQAAAAVHARLLAAAEALPPPATMPPVGVAGTLASLPEPSPADATDPPQPPVAAEMEVVVGFTGNVIGETDPCG